MTDQRQTFWSAPVRGGALSLLVSGLVLGAVACGAPAEEAAAGQATASIQVEAAEMAGVEPAEATQTATHAASATTVEAVTPDVPVEAESVPSIVAPEAAVSGAAEAVETAVAAEIDEAAAPIVTAAQSATEAAPQDEVVALAGDAEAGARAFAVCKACHTVQAGRNGLGPSLAGLVGRQSGSIEGFNYSDAMKASNVTWTPENLDTYLKNSGEFIPGNRMAQLFRQGVQDDTKRADIIAYLATQ